MQVNCHDLQNKQITMNVKEKSAEVENWEVSVHCVESPNIARQEVCWKRRSLCTLCMRSMQSVCNRIQGGIEFHPESRKKSLRIQHWIKNRLILSKMKSRNQKIRKWSRSLSINQYYSCWRKDNAEDKDQQAGRSSYTMNVIIRLIMDILKLIRLKWP